MNEAFFAELSAWLTQAGLAGTPETAIVSGFCDRCVAAGLPLARSLLFIDTLHPVHEGRLFRWGYQTLWGAQAGISAQNNSGWTLGIKGYTQQSAQFDIWGGQAYVRYNFFH